jgi:hypothetical protein
MVVKKVQGDDRQTSSLAQQDRKATTKFNEQYKTLVRLAVEAAEPAHVR